MNEYVTKFWMGAWRILLTLSLVVLGFYGGLHLYLSAPYVFLSILVVGLFFFMSYTLGNVIYQTNEFQKKLDETVKKYDEVTGRNRNDPKV